MKAGERICAFSNPRGFTLIEILVALLLLGMAIVPMLNAFAPAMLSIGGEEETTVFTSQARGTLNRIASLDFNTLSANLGTSVDLAALFGSAAEADKEAFSFKNVNYSPIVSITDVSGGIGGLLEITTTIDHIVMKTLKAEY
jgi:prepilin-type N-terminal cleavage/methylation domain-containing protein